MLRSRCGTWKSLCRCAPSAGSSTGPRADWRRGGVAMQLIRGHGQPFGVAAVAQVARAHRQLHARRRVHCDGLRGHGHRHCTSAAAKNAAGQVSCTNRPPNTIVTPSPAVERGDGRVGVPAAVPRRDHQHRLAPEPVPSGLRVRDAGGPEGARRRHLCAAVRPYGQLNFEAPALCIALERPHGMYIIGLRRTDDRC